MTRTSVVLSVLFVLFLVVGCSLTPEKLESGGATAKEIGQTVSTIGKVVPGPIGLGIEAIGSIIAAAGAASVSIATAMKKSREAAQAQEIAEQARKTASAANHEKEAATAALDATVAAVEKKGSVELKHQINKEARKRKVSGYVEAFVADKAG